MTTDDLLARADEWVGRSHDWPRLGGLVQDLAAEVRALTARLDAAHDRLNLALEGLGVVAGPDALLDANEQVFDRSAARRMQAQAEATLRAVMRVEAATADPTPACGLRGCRQCTAYPTPQTDSDRG